MNYIYKAITIIFLLYILFNVIAFGLVAVNSNRMKVFEKEAEWSSW